MADRRNPRNGQADRLSKWVTVGEGLPAIMQRYRWRGARTASPLAFEAAVVAMAPATKAAITSDLKCYVPWCARQRPVATAIPALPETLVHYRRWLAQGSDTRSPINTATLARRIASIARVHRSLSLGETEPPRKPAWSATRSRVSDAPNGNARSRLRRHAWGSR